MFSLCQKKQCFDDPRKDIKWGRYNINDFAIYKHYYNKFSFVQLILIHLLHFFHVLISNKWLFYLNSWFCLDYLWLRYSRNYSLLPCLNTCHNLSRLRNEALQKKFDFTKVCILQTSIKCKYLIQRKLE